MVAQHQEGHVLHFFRHVRRRLAGERPAGQRLLEPILVEVGEAMAAYVLAQAYLEKFSSDSMTELKAAVALYENGLEERGLWHRS